MIYGLIRCLPWWHKCVGWNWWNEGCRCGVEVWRGSVIVKDRLLAAFLTVFLLLLSFSNFSPPFLFLSSSFCYLSIALLTCKCSKVGAHLNHGIWNDGVNRAAYLAALPRPCWPRARVSRPSVSHFWPCSLIIRPPVSCQTWIPFSGCFIH